MRIKAELLLCQGRQAVVTAAEVDRPGGDHHPHRLGRHDHALLARSAAAISATRAAGLSPASRTTTPPTSISIGAGAGAGAGA
jgi:hypothetical protein